MGWFTVFFYFLTSAVTLFIAFRHRTSKTDFQFWGLLAFFLFLLGINKQLDLQSLFTETGRFIARQQGWYERRRSVQLVFVVLFGCFSIMAILMVWWMVRGQWRNYLFPLTGFMLLMAFIIIRAASFHHVDHFLKKGPAGVRMNWVLELGGIGVVLVSAMRKMGGEKRLTTEAQRAERVKRRLSR